MSLRKFCKLFFGFMILPLLIVSVDLLSAPNAFTFRQWEALQCSYPYFLYGSFYPLQTITMDEVGDMGRHTPYEIKKHTEWKTDALGFRNDQYIIDPAILLIGDSFFAGSTLTQDSTVTGLLQDKIDSVNFPGSQKVYNISPNEFAKFDFLLRHRKIQKPKVIVFSVVERSVNDLAVFYPKQTQALKERINTAITDVLPYQVPMYIDRLVKLSLLRYLSVKVNPAGLVNSITKKSNASGNEKKMLFLDNNVYKNDKASTVSEKVVAALRSYKKYCDSLGIQFLFVPLPDKETLYYDKISPENTQSTFLYKLDAAMQKNNISSINALQVLNDAKKQSPQTILYQYDDTHWNATAVDLISKEIMKKITTK